MFEINLYEFNHVFQAIQNTLQVLNSTIPKITIALGMLFVVGCKKIGLSENHTANIIRNLYNIAHIDDDGSIHFPGKITFIPADNENNGDLDVN